MRVTFSGKAKQGMLMTDHFRLVWTVFRGGGEKTHLFAPCENALVGEGGESQSSFVHFKYICVRVCVCVCVRGFYKIHFNAVG